MLRPSARKTSKSLLRESGEYLMKVGKLVAQPVIFHPLRRLASCDLSRGERTELCGRSWWPFFCGIRGFFYGGHGWVDKCALASLTRVSVFLRQNAPIKHKDKFDVKNMTSRNPLWISGFDFPC